jgi:DNA-binding FadR family transcriptional regulator
MEAAASLVDRDAAVAADVRFHKGIIAACQNDLLARDGDLIAVGLVVSFENWSASYSATLPMHGVVLSAIRERSGPAARQAMLDLLRTTKSFLTSQILR